MNKVLIVFISTLLFGGCASSDRTLKSRQGVTETKPQRGVPTPQLIAAGEYRFKALKKLTFEGTNTQATFNAQSTELIFQSTRDGFQCNQTFKMDVDGRGLNLVSSGLGTSADGRLFPHSPKLVYGSNHKTQKYCDVEESRTGLKNLARSNPYTLVSQAFDIYVSDHNGNHATPLSPHHGYDSESAISPNGNAIVFTSMRSGDIELWVMDPDGTNAKQLTHEIGFDGGAAFNFEGTQLVYRANHPNEKATVQEYKQLLSERLVDQRVTDLFVMNADGSNKTNILSNGAANVAPSFHPDGTRIVFSSNMDDPKRENFSIYMINTDGSGLERITYDLSSDGFPSFSHDGTQLVFTSTRGSTKKNPTNIFLADWTDDKPKLSTLSKDSKTSWLEHTKKLSSAQMQGRGLGTKGIKRAEAYLVQELNKIGYEAKRQSFLVDVAVAVKKSKIKIGKKNTGYDINPEDINAFSFSADAKVQGQGVFVGYGNSTKGGDDYKGVDAKGKVVFAMTNGSGQKYAAINAKNHGAVALILVNSANLKPDKAMTFEPTRGRVGIPVFSMTWSSAAKIFGSIKNPILGTAKLNTEELGDFEIQLEAEIARKEIPATNIFATLPGAKNKERRSIIVGAHFDHLGFGGEGSLSPGEKTLHPGADDNASGVATVLEIAKHLKLNNSKFARDIVFVLFSGEETGLLGSQHFVSDPTTMKGVEFMVNFDMIGRMNESRLELSGTHTAKDLVGAIRRAQLGLGLNIQMFPGGFGPSDQSSFFAKKVPVLHFFTGLHEDYHRPSDTFEKLNVEGAEKVGILALRIITELANRESIEFSNNAPKKTHTTSSHTHHSSPKFGSIPSAKQAGKGVLLDGVLAGSSAERAGLKAGDLIVKFGTYQTLTLLEYSSAIRNQEKGDVVIVVERDGIQLKLQASIKIETSEPRKQNPHE